MAVYSVIVFYYKVWSPYPDKPAGLYALIAETIAKNGFAFPRNIPFYGPGGMPFAYPPLAFYLMAFVNVYFKVSAFAYMRFAPSLFLVLSIIPLYLLVKAMGGSRRQAAIAAGFMGTSYGIIINQYYSPGICRGVALVLMLYCLYFAYQAFFAPRKRYVALALVFLALTTLTHFSYAVFGILGIITFALFSKQMHFWKRIWICALMGAGAALLISPWWLTIISRYGISIFTNLLSTHDNARLISVIHDIPGQLVTLGNSLLTYRFENPILIGTAILGLAFSIASKKYLLPAWLLISLIVVGGDGQRFIAIISALLGAYAVEELLAHLPPMELKIPNLNVRNIILFLVLALLSVISVRGAFILRLGNGATSYQTVIAWMTGIGLLARLPAFYFFLRFTDENRPDGINLRQFITIFVSLSAASLIILVAGILLHATKLMNLQIPVTVILLDWLITLGLVYALYEIRLKIRSDDGRFLSAAVILVLVGLGIFISRPDLFYINSKVSITFFNNVQDISQWLQTNEPSSANFLMVSEDNNYDLPGVLRYDDEWFPYLLKRTEVVDPFGAEWTGQYGQQTFLLGEIHSCSQIQSAECIDSLIKTYQLKVDLLITDYHQEPFSLYVGLLKDGHWKLQYHNQGLAVWAAGETSQGQ
jgi:4-amino-4-deoxy-L-arabinose transferase-like glycosyltransferase